MNIIKESEADCFTLVDSLLPYLMVLSFILGFMILKLLNNNSSLLEVNSLTEKHLKAQKNFENERANKLY